MTGEREVREREVEILKVHLLDTGGNKFTFENIVNLEVTDLVVIVDYVQGLHPRKFISPLVNVLDVQLVYPPIPDEEVQDMPYLGGHAQELQDKYGLKVVSS